MTSGNAAKKRNVTGWYPARAGVDWRGRRLFFGALGDTAIVTVIGASSSAARNPARRETISWEVARGPWARPFTKVVRAPGLPDSNRPSAIITS
jgi:hypothetical protein